MNKLFATGLVAAITLTSGCSSIINGTTDTLSVRSSNREAQIYINGVPMGTEGSVFTAKRGENYILEAKADDCQTGTIQTTHTFDATSLLGILIDFGIFSIPIDLISGAAWKPSQSVYMVNPVCAPQKPIQVG